MAQSKPRAAGAPAAAEPSRRERAQAVRARRQIKETTAAPDPRALVAYNEWLHMERRMLALEMYPEAGSDAERVVPHAPSSSAFHFPAGRDWRDTPRPSSRAEAILGAVGVKWRGDPKPTGVAVASEAGSILSEPPGALPINLSNAEVIARAVDLTAFAMHDLAVAHREVCTLVDVVCAFDCRRRSANKDGRSPWGGFLAGLTETLDLLRVRIADEATAREPNGETEADEALEIRLADSVARVDMLEPAQRTLLMKALA